MREKKQGLEETTSVTVEDIETSLKQTRETIAEFRTRGVGGNCIDKLELDEKDLREQLKILNNEGK